ncbi:MAG: hypothetical protein H0W08_08750, partial [Acidobacteria bacterium]|nr:hypothetical protein [Acidobacteriota bacterium]
MAQPKHPADRPDQGTPRPESRPPDGGSPASTITSARERLDRLIDSKLRATPRRGALEVALALAAVTQKVRVNAATEPFVTTPADLLERTFDDASVAIDSAGMAAFKANLASLLPGIAAAIRAIPEDPRLRIGDVARLVALSLPLQLWKARREGRPPQTPSIVTARPVHDAREHARNRYGTHFAVKATDAVLMTMRRDAGVSFGIMRSPMRESTVRGQTPDTLVLELNVPAVQERESSTSLLASGPSIRAAARSVEREGTDRRVGSSGLLRQAHVANIRDRFFKAIAPLYSEIGSRVSAPGGAEALSTRRTLDVCWLNQTLRTIAVPEALAEAAADDT